MARLPRFTKRAADQIAHLEAVRRRALPPGNYMSFMGWRHDFELDSPSGPVFGVYYFSDAEGVPEEFQVECHGVRLAYDIHERSLTRLGPSTLDFDGDQFVFIKNEPSENS